MRTRPLLACLAAAGCAGSAQTAPGPTVAEAPSAAPASSAAPAPSAPAGAASGAPAEEPYSDPDEHDPATLTPLIGKGDHPTFPKATVGDKQCWQDISLVGDARRDFDVLVARCGTPTGSIEYVKPAVGKLHSTFDKRDDYQVKVRGGLCYRFFAVADGSVKDLDILIEKPGNVLVGDDETTGPVAIIKSDGPWCFDGDGEYVFRVEVDGIGTGHYVFGVWARGKK